MSIDDWYEWVAQIALGWLHWTEERALNSDVNSILVAWEGHKDSVKWANNELLLAAFGAKEPGTDQALAIDRTGQPAKFTPKVFDSLFGAERRQVKGRK